MKPKKSLTDIDGWIVRDDKVLASVSILSTYRQKLVGVCGCDNLDCAVLLCNTRSVHTFGVKLDLDVAFLDSDNYVIKMLRLRRNRVTAPIWRARSVLEAQAGAFGHWELKIGDQLEVRE